MSEAMRRSPAAGCPSDGEAASFVVDGFRPRTVVEPASEGDVAAALRDADGSGDAVIVVGGGTHMALGNVPTRYDVALSTRGLRSIVAYEPDDLTVTCQGGVRLIDLQADLAVRNQYLPIDVSGEGATVGGIVAANGAGAMRHAHGTVRDWVIGMRVAHADGSISKAGGRVVKNVTGYEMTKLYTGSLGTLVAITEVTFKLAPVPVVTQTVSIECANAAHGAALLLRARDAGLAMRRAELMAPEASRRVVGTASWQALVDVAGGAAAVDRTMRGLASHGAVVEQNSEVWAAWRSALATGGLWLRFGAMPSRVGEMMRTLHARSPGASISATVCAGVVRFRRAGAGDDEAAPAVAQARDVAAEYGATMVVEEAPVAVKRRLDVFGEAPGDIEIMRRLKRAFDPRGTLAPGRLVGRI